MNAPMTLNESAVAQVAAPLPAHPVLLLVDDESNILNALRRLFRPAGYEVLTAPGGQEALDLLASRPVDAIISDMRMPGMSGAELLEAACTRWPDTVRILLTGYADMGSTIDAINRGRIYRYVSKPWDDAELLTAVAQGLRLRQLERETQRLQQLTQRQNAELQELNGSLEAKVRERTSELTMATAMIETAHRDLKQTFHDSVRVFSGLIELRGTALAGHARRVAETARAIAIKMQLSGTAVPEVVLAALLHDIGKIALSDAAVTLPASAMCSEDRAALLKHPAKGEAALMGLAALRGAAKLVRHHHERFDGDGYPDQLVGAAIPLGARILAVAEDFDELQIGLAEKNRMNAKDACARILEGRGKRYDPDVVDAFLQLQGALPRNLNDAERLVKASELIGGMILARDLVSADGILLLPKDSRLEPDVITQIRVFERQEGSHFSIYVRNV